jgi:hypothetical protein
MSLNFFQISKSLPFFTLMLLSTFAYPKDVSLYFYGDDDSDEWHGAIQGLKEANAQGKFLKLQYALIAKKNLSEVKTYQPYAVISSLPPNDLSQALRANPEIPFFNLRIMSNDAVTTCAPNLFHIRPHHSALAAAETAWNLNKTMVAKAVLWHHTLKKYAAAQLNKRFEKNANRKMNPASWAGWASVKLFSDVLARNVPTSETTSLSFLKNNLAFDGQKGKNMFFNELNYLEQPLLFIYAEKIIGEVTTSRILPIGSRTPPCK